MGTPHVQGEITNQTKGDYSEGEADCQSTHKYYGHGIPRKGAETVHKESSGANEPRLSLSFGVVIVANETGHVEAVRRK